MRGKPHYCCWLLLLLLLLLLIVAVVVVGDSNEQQQKQQEKHLQRRWRRGFQFRFFPMMMMNKKEEEITAATTSTSTSRDNIQKKKRQVWHQKLLMRRRQHARADNMQRRGRNNNGNINNMEEGEARVNTGNEHKSNNDGRRRRRLVDIARRVLSKTGRRSKGDRTTRNKNANTASTTRQSQDVTASANDTKYNGNIPTTPTLADCTSPIDHGSRRRRRGQLWRRKLSQSVLHYDNDQSTIVRAYRMAILSAMAYWNFHKREGQREAEEGEEPLLGVHLIHDENRRDGTLIKTTQQSSRIGLCQTNQALLSGVANTNAIIDSYFYPTNDKNLTNNANNKVVSTNTPCQELAAAKAEKSGRHYDFQWQLYNWYEPTPLVARWHDTDLLVSTSGDDTLILSFAGTQSAADAFTNVQTFEPVHHSSLFPLYPNITGSIHRGFLNAYSRVERGLVARICSSNDDKNGGCDTELTKGLLNRYGHCFDDDTQTQQKLLKNDTRRKPSTCRASEERLMDILRELVTTALQSGRKVEITGHSLGGSLASLLMADIVLNFPSVPVSKLFLWTYGAPEVVDETFLQSAMAASPRFKTYIQNRGKKRRFHRYVTLSDQCKADLVSTIASTALPSHKRGLHGRLARGLGGLRGGAVHIAEPYFLFPQPQQAGNNTQEAIEPSTTGSTLDAHTLISYLRGISRESFLLHPLQSNLPAKVKDFIGER